MKRTARALLYALIIFMVTGCATQVRMVVTKPAEVNLAGVKTLSILDFEYMENRKSFTLDKLLDEALNQLFDQTGSSLSKEEKIARYATGKMFQTISDTGYFNIVDAGDFKNSVDAVTERIQFFNVLSGVYDVDGVMLGTINNMNTLETYEMRTVIIVDEETGEEKEVQEQWVTRKADIEFEYRILSTHTSELLVQKVFTKSTSDSEKAENYNSLTSEEQMYRGMLDSIIQTVSRQIVPYQVTESRSLMKDKTKNPVMETADQYVKVAKYRDALEIFLSVWQDSRNIAAGFNAAIMYEAMGDLVTAIEQMEGVLHVYPEKKVFRAVERLKAAKIEQDKAMAQMQGRT